MPQHTLVVRTYKRTVRGRIRLCGSVSTEDGRVLVEALDQPTLKDLSRALRKGGYISTKIVIEKRCRVEFQYSGNIPPG